MHKHDNPNAQPPVSSGRFLPPIRSSFGGVVLLVTATLGTTLTLAVLLKLHSTAVRATTANARTAAQTQTPELARPIMVPPTDRAKLKTAPVSESPGVNIGKAIVLGGTGVKNAIAPSSLSPLATKTSPTFTLNAQPRQFPPSPTTSPPLQGELEGSSIPPSAKSIHPQSSPPVAASRSILKVFSGARKPAALLAQAQPKPNQQETVTTGRGIQLTLADVVILVLQNNKDIKNAYLERIAQRQDLAVAEDRFVPDFTPRLSFNLDRFGSGGNTSTNSDLGVGATVEVTVPTGGRLSFGWETNGQTSNINNFNVDRDNNLFGSNLQLRLTQPLLRGAGVAVNQAPIEIARLDERANIQGLKSTLINTITEAILVYRNLLRAQERLNIEQISLESARQILEFNQALIEAGRLAPVEIVQSQTDIANREVSLLEARNNLESVKLTLLDILDIEQTLNIEPVEKIVLQSKSLDLNNLKQIAFQNRPDYLQAQFSLERTKFERLIADNNRRWNLDLDAGYGDSLDDTTQLTAGLILSRTFGDLTVERDYQRSQVNFQKAENTLESLRQSIDIEVTDRVRNVNLSLRQVQLAQQARQLAERTLQIEQEKLRLGRGSIFQVVSFQNNLVEARNRELDATIDYLNALTNLDQSVGTTLETWQVTIERK
ncbi:TolC family protein [Coleofasciculus sp. FACHB-64]|uniref:TolC family protein n=1 Tax=Cyanophyceae TaxID=3028117 RepID=UPI001684739D|nr:MULTISPECIES: TolC family protein [unclassified Coleofasciculus]MBD1942529.1 TolC family protein [Coleofasciculus sp. FACHB-712]MBD2048768.1 TolC family protein [Coleofasciculus sp. FACHB-64]